MTVFKHIATFYGFLSFYNSIINLRLFFVQTLLCFPFAPSLPHSFPPSHPCSLIHPITCLLPPSPPPCSFTSRLHLPNLSLYLLFLLFLSPSSFLPLTLPLPSSHHCLSSPSYTPQTLSSLPSHSLHTLIHAHIHTPPPPSHTSIHAHTPVPSHLTF